MNEICMYAWDVGEKSKVQIGITRKFFKRFYLSTSKISFAVQQQQKKIDGCGMMHHSFASRILLFFLASTSFPISTLLCDMIKLFTFHYIRIFVKGVCLQYWEKHAKNFLYKYIFGKCWIMNFQKNLQILTCKDF